MIGIGLSAYFAQEAQRLNAEFHQWLDARPMETTIELSKSGETTAAFHQTCSISHGEAMFLECDLDDQATQNLDELLKGLYGTVVVKDSDGNEVESVKFSSGTACHWDDKIMLAGFAPFGKGEYVATIRVDSGAPGLADAEQTVYAEYQLCGLERMPATITAAFAIGAGLVGLISAACVLPGLRGGVWKSVSTEDA